MRLLTSSLYLTMLMEGATSAREVMPPNLYKHWNLEDALKKPVEQRIPRQVAGTFNRLVMWNARPDQAEPEFHGFISFTSPKTTGVRKFTFGNGFTLPEPEVTREGRVFWCIIDFWGDTTTMSGLGKGIYHFVEKGKYINRLATGYLRQGSFYKTFLDKEEECRYASEAAIFLEEFAAAGASGPQRYR